MKKLKVKINSFFPENGNNLFWTEWKAYGPTDVAIFKCRPTKAYKTKNAFTFVFGDEFTVKLPARNNSPVLSKWITAVSADIPIQIELGEFRSASYNFGDPLPSRYYINAIKINGENFELYEYVDGFYPWFKNDICSVIRLVKGILKKYKEMRNEG